MISKFVQLLAAVTMDMDVERIKQAAKVYDITIVFHLQLKQHKLLEIQCVSQCVNLRTLDISHNNIEDLSPLSNLPNLRRLNAAYNNITKLNALQNVPQLEYVDLQCNNISSFVQVAHLSSIRNFPNLKQIHLRGIGASDAVQSKPNNPICKDSSYATKIMDIFKSRIENEKQIISIDHRRILCNATYQSIDRLLQERKDEKDREEKIKSEEQNVVHWLQEAVSAKKSDDANGFDIDCKTDLQFQTAKKQLEAMIRSSKNELSKVDLDFKKL